MDELNNSNYIKVRFCFVFCFFREKKSLYYREVGMWKLYLIEEII